MDPEFVKEMLTDNQAELLFTTSIAIISYLVGRFDLADKRRTPKEKKVKAEKTPTIVMSEKPAEKTQQGAPNGNGQQHVNSR